MKEEDVIKMIRKENLVWIRTGKTIRYTESGTGVKDFEKEGLSILCKEEMADQVIKVLHELE